MRRLTPAQVKALAFIAANEPVARFPMPGPSLRMVRKLFDFGLITTAGKEPGVLGFQKYATTEAGRLALAEQEKGR